MSEHYLDQFLGDQVREATREEVLEALRGHILGTVVIELELTDGTSLVQVQGRLLEADRDNPDSWETAEVFAIDHDDAYVNSYHATPDRWQDPGAANVTVSARSPSAYLLHVPETGIECYPGVRAGASGYRFGLGCGVKLAVMLWQDVMHVAETGDIAPGMGDFTAEVTGEDQS